MKKGKKGRAGEVLRPALCPMSPWGPRSLNPEPQTLNPEPALSLCPMLFAFFTMKDMKLMKGGKEGFRKGGGPQTCLPAGRFTQIGKGF